jgi:O-antigen/teichoic acid export membrane protein
LHKSREAGLKLFGFLFALGTLLSISVFSIDTIKNSDYFTVLATVSILLFGLSVGSAGSIAGYVLVLLGKPDVRVKAQTLGLAGNLVFLVGLTPSLGVYGAALASVIGSSLASIINLLVLKNLLNTGFDNERDS